MSESTMSNGILEWPSQSSLPVKETLEGLAVIGFSLRFPGEASDEESFWKMLIEGRCAMTEIPKDRMNIDAFYHPDVDRHDTIPVRGGHFLNGSIDAFDAPFFSITVAEAKGLDPQQRILLETTYHALENAGIPMNKILGSKTSVHTGCFTTDYAALSSRDPEEASKYGAIGTSPAMLANRISWFFDLVGPSVNLDSACSSSMMALDQACQALWNGDTTMAIVGGCNLVYSLDGLEYLSNMGFLSPSSRCFSFDTRANGYARGEGFGVLIIKRVSDAIRDKDTIRAVIRSTGSNQDGRTPGVTQPSKDSQEQLIKDTYAKARLNMNDTAFFEAHGTGTAVGDPIEAGAIGAAFRRQDTQQKPLIIGALKANIGHLEGASGVAALIKTIMILERGIIPPIADLQSLNYKIDAEYLRLQFPKSARPWPTTGTRRASVNSFGFGGANSHVVLDDAYHYLRERKIVGNVSFRDSVTTININEKRGEVQNGGTTSVEHVNVDNRPKILVWSAADEGGVNRLTETYTKHFLSHSFLRDEESEEYLENLAYTLSNRRSKLPWRTFAISDSISTLQELQRILAKPVRAASRINIGFVFTGQGAQWPEMGRDLLQYPVFKESLVDGELYLQSLGCEWSLIGELLKPKAVSRIHNPELSQPLCTALQIALVGLLKSFGVYPASVIGHSSGEIAAAYSANAISKKAAYKIAYFRGKHAATLTGCSDTPLGMMAVALSEKEIQPYLRKLRVQKDRNPLVVGCVNSPTSITISGDLLQIDDLKERLDEDSVFARKLSVTVAYHSPYMHEVSSLYCDSIQVIEPGESSNNGPPMISSVTGQRVSKEQLAQPSYWVQNMVSQVKFSQALEVMCSSPAKRLVKKIDGSHRYSLPIHSVLEIGPHSALRGPISDTLKLKVPEQQIGYISTLTRFVPSTRPLLEVCGYLYCVGAPIDLEAINKSSHLLPKNLTDLPAYPFDHSQTYWYESRISIAHRFRKNGRQDLLGVPASDWNVNEARWRNILRASDIPWIKDHKINRSPLYPAVGMLVMAIEGAKQLSDGARVIRGYKIKDAFFEAPLNTTLSSEGVETQLFLRPNKSSIQQGSWLDFQVCTFVDGEWLENCHGCIQVEYWEEKAEINDTDERKAEALQFKKIFQDALSKFRSVDTSFLYKRMDDCGFNYGPAFRPLNLIACSDHWEAIAEVQQFEWLPSTHFQPHVVHPTTFDGILQLIFTALTKGGAEDLPTIIPTYIHKMWISNQGLSPSTPTSTPTTVKAHVRSELKGFRGSQSSLFVLDVDNELCMTVDGIETTLVASLGIPDAPAGEMQRCYNIDWKLDLRMADTKQIMNYCRHQDELKEDKSFYKDLTQVLFWFIRKTTDVISSRMPDFVPPHISRYIEWMKIQLASFNIGSLPDSDTITANIDENEMERLCEHLKNSNRRGKLFVEVGQNLLNFLYGDLDPLGFFFRGDLVKDYYHEVFDSVNCMAGLGRYLDALAHCNPSMKILEVGAGTGGMTGHILNTLLHHGESEVGTPRYGQYDYTDISPSFFEKAQETFKSQAGRMNFRTLNVDEDPVLQGLDEHQYDVVIASSVLHATRNLDTTLKNLRKLLKTGGKLIVFEITKPEKLRTGFVFGLLPGWWLGNEEVRQWSPCIATHQWHEVLLRTGYSGSEIVFDDYRDPLCHEMSVIISTATPEQRITDGMPLSITHVTFVIEAGSEFQDTVSSRIQRQLRTEDGLDSEILTFDEALDQSEREISLYVFLPELERPLLSNLDCAAFETFKNVILTAKNALWITQGSGNSLKPEYGLIDGLGRVLRSENDKLRLVTLALEMFDSATELPIDNIIKVILSIISNEVNEYEPEYREDKVGLQIGRLVEAKYLEEEIFTRTATTQSKVQPFGKVQALKLTVTFPGLLNTLAFVEDESYKIPIGPEEIEIEVKAVGVNFKDCLVALGRVNQNTMGVECSGIVSRAGEQSSFKPGDRVVTCSLNTFRTFARVNSQCAVAIPDGVEFKDAAALAANFTTAWHALHEVARIQPGESILIHSGAGGTGQAAIQVAQYHGAEVYATVSSKEKRDLLMNLYKIPQDHIFSSRDTSFAQGIRRMTNGKGIDVVLNSLTGEELVASWELIAKYGRFIEIGIKDIEAHKSLPMFPFAQNVSFSAIDISAMSLERLPIVQKALQSWMRLYTKGEFHAAQPLKCYTASDVEDAFRCIQSGKNVGKMVIELNKEDPVMTILKTKPTTRFRSNATYLVCGGLGGLGRSISRWMASQGAKNLILLSRSGAQSAEAIILIDELKSKGINVEAPACNVADLEHLVSVLNKVTQSMPPIRGCIQAAMVLKDSIFANMSYESWKVAISSKVQGSWNLHSQLQDLDFFILLSSITGVLGAAGQANYAAGNTYLDALAHYRITKGQPAVSLDLGVMKGEGFLAENKELLKRWSSPGYFIEVPQEQLFAMLDYYCDPSLPLPTELKSQPIIGIDIPAKLRSRGIEIPYWMRRPLLRQLYEIESVQYNSVAAQETVINYSDLLSEAESLNEAGLIVAQLLKRKHSVAFSIPEEQIHVQDSMVAHGVDSLVAVELRSWFGKEFGVDIAIFDLLGGATFITIGMMVARKSPFSQYSRDRRSKSDT